MTQKLVVFKLDEQYYALEISNVNEIIKMLPVTQIPNKKNHIEGIIMLRGDICTVLSGRALLGMEKKPISDEQYIILMDNRKIGMIVDEVSEITDVEEINYQSVEAVKSMEGIDSIIDVNDKLVALLNVNKLLNRINGKSKPDEEQVLGD